MAQKVSTSSWSNELSPHFTIQLKLVLLNKLAKPVRSTITNSLVPLRAERQEKLNTKPPGIILNCFHYTLKGRGCKLVNNHSVVIVVFAEFHELMVCLARLPHRCVVVPVVTTIHHYLS